MKKLGCLLALLTVLLTAQLSAQSYAFGVKGGLTLGVQNWSGFEQDPLIAYHGIAFIESAPEGNEFALFAQGGYHVKGSAIRNRNFVNVLTGNAFRAPPREFRFNNVSVTLGGKQKFDFGVTNNKVYYMFGIRGDYTVSTNLGEYTAFNERNPGYAIYPFDEPTFIRDFNYGVTVGGGMEIPFSEFVAGLLEVSVNPDFSYQYRQPEIPNVLDPYTGNTRSIPERQIRNITFEVSLGFRFLHKIEYID